MASANLRPTTLRQWTDTCNIESEFKEEMRNNSNRGQQQALENLHKILLQMMTEIDKLCIKHNIPYYLNGGNALGAIRHNGFIPWDDDMDIMMHTKDYRKFLQICRTELDPQKWYIQEAGKDWPGCFSKVRLKDTYIEDVGEWNGIDDANRGVFIDIFEIVHAPKQKILKLHQYACAKLMSAFSLYKKGYKTSSKKKKCIITISRILALKPIYELVRNGVYRYTSKDTGMVANLFGMARFHSAFYDKEVFGEPIYHKYEDIELPLPTLYEVYLRSAFGNYMKLPPIEKQKPAHALKINFGNYIN